MNDGAVAESRFVTEALSRGLVVSMPTFRSARYDFVVTRGDRPPIRVQVKSCARKTARKANHTPKYSVELRRTPRSVEGRIGPKQRYSRRAFDVLAVWLDEDRRWLFVPRRRIRPGQRLSVTPHVGIARHLDNWDALLK